jgi:hypothetical protein
MQDAAIPQVRTQREGPVETQDVMTKATGLKSAGGTGACFRRVVLGAAVLVGLVLVAAACSGGSGGAGVAQSGGGETNGPSPSPSSGGSALAYSRCMRAHGVTNFPDPDSSGDITIQSGSGLDPNDPVFRSAQQACQSLAPTPSGDQQHGTSAQALRFSQCMRAHGFSDFPDPQVENGRIQIGPFGPGSGLDPNDPQFQAAWGACQHYLPAGRRESGPPGG